MLRIDDDQYEALAAHARAEYPNEACALLGGRDGSVERVYALPNAEASPTFYVVEPKAQLKAMTEMDDLGLDLVGIFHSHVATEAYPSRTDVELAAYPDAVYLILSGGPPGWPDEAARRAARLPGLAPPGPGRPLRAMSGPAGHRRLSPAPPRPTRSRRP